MSSVGVSMLGASVAGRARHAVPLRERIAREIAFLLGREIIGER
jgi:hypothetical protein